MAFGTISTLFLPSAFLASGVGGTRVAALDDVAGATENTATTVGHQSNATSRRPVSPYQPSGVNQTPNPGPTTGNGNPDFGLAIASADSGSVSGARRFFLAGTHTVHFYATGGNTLGNNTYRAQLYRVGSNGTTKTFIAGNAAGVTGSGLGATIAVPITVPQVILEPGETVQYCLDGECNPGILTGNITYTFGTGGALAGNTVARITTPEFGILANGRGNADGAAAVDGKGALLIPTRGASAGSSSADGVFSATAGMVGNADGSSTADGRLGAVAGFVGNADGSSTADGRLSAIAGMVGNSDGTSSADGRLSATAGFVGNAAGAATVDGRLGAIAAFRGDSAGAATVDGRASSVAGAVGNAEGVASVDGRITAIKGAYGTVTIGAPGSETEYPDGLLVRRADGRLKAVRANLGALPPGALRIIRVPQ